MIRRICGDFRNFAASRETTAEAPRLGMPLAPGQRHGEGPQYRCGLRSVSALRGLLSSLPAVAFLRPLAVGLRGVFTPARELETDGGRDADFRKPAVGGARYRRVTRRSAHHPCSYIAIPRLTTHDSRLTTHDSRLTAHGSRLTAHGSPRASLCCSDLRSTTERSPTGRNRCGHHRPRPRGGPAAGATADIGPGGRVHSAAQGPSHSSTQMRSLGSSASRRAWVDLR